jgi:arabinofuranosyltransferase
LFVPYLLFNLALSGTPMPNTFYAKQAEYVDWQNTPIDTRLFYFLIQFFAGSSLVVLPGFLQKIYGALRRREWGIPLTALWMFGYILLYILRLPVYQHGRYLMPAMGIFLLIGLMGFVEFLPSMRTYRTRLGRQASLAAVVMLSLAFGGYGAYTYGSDVALIETEMVASAKWAAQNIPPEALIAAHDIGALGFFGQHATLIDLAGLISPEVVPFIRDEDRLASYMDERHVDYLIAFPNWYPALAQYGMPVFTASGHFVSDPDVKNMTIYRWSNP